jgi:sugar phosphate isomerase/epimerase
MVKYFYLFTYLVILSSNLSAQSQNIPALGVCTTMENAELVSRNGFQFIQPTVAEVLQPFVADSVYDAAQILSSPTPVSVVNVFIPGSIKVVGPAVDEAQILNYAKTVFRRAEALGIQTIVFGSGASRRIPDGFDPDTAWQQFVGISKKLAALAATHNIILALESQNKLECNFLNTVKDCIEVADAVNHQNFKITIDIYHMFRENEPASIILDGAKHIHHCDIGEKETRSAPGIAGDDFVPFFKAFQQIGYTGKIALECRFKNMATELPMAMKTIHEQWQQALKSD